MSEITNARALFRPQRRLRCIPLSASGSVGVGYLLSILISVFAVYDGVEASDARMMRKPNFIFIVADDLNLAEVDSMPNILSALANSGLSFTNHFTVSPLCVPSRVSTLLGQYSHNHQVLTNRAPDGGFQKFQEMGHEDSTVAVRLQSHGYRTGLFGKYMNGYPETGNEGYVPPGWDEWVATIGSYYNYQINENGEIFNYRGDPEDYETDVLSSKVTDFIKTNPRSIPFFIYVAPNAPHNPAIPAPRHADAFPDAIASRSASFNEEDVSDKPSWVQELESLRPGQIAGIDDLYRERLRSMLAVDEMVRAIIDTLSVTGQLDKTYIFFTSDHGYHMGEHRIEKGKESPYEEVVHIPLLVRGPRIPAGVIADQLTATIDIVPTLLDLASAPIPSSIDGISVAPLLRAQQTGEPWRLGIIIERWPRAEGVPANLPPYQLLRTADRHYVEYDNEEIELYDMELDPYQLHSDPSLGDTLLAEVLESLRSCTGAGCIPQQVNAREFQEISGSDGQSLHTGSPVPRVYSLGQNHPNPFNPETEIHYTLPEGGQVTLKVYSMLGEEIAVLFDGYQDAGHWTVRWTGTSIQGASVAGGIYLAQLTAGGFRAVRKMVLLR